MLQRCSPLPFHVLFTLFFLLAIRPATQAQVTTGTIEGLVLDDHQQPIPGATVRITYGPTGGQQGTTTFADGRFIVANLRPGGPYQVRITAVGFADEQRNNLSVALGGASRQRIILHELTQDLQTVTVTGRRDDVRRGETGDCRVAGAGREGRCPCRQLACCGRTGDDRIGR